MELIVYRRPRCQFSVRLLNALDRERVLFREINIWKDPESAAFVRSVADGRETVPTVALGGENWVNPEPAELLTILREKAPQLVGAGNGRPWWRPRMF